MLFLGLIFCGSVFAFEQGAILRIAVDSKEKPQVRRSVHSKGVSADDLSGKKQPSAGARGRSRSLNKKDFAQLAYSSQDLLQSYGDTLKSSVLTSTLSELDNELWAESLFCFSSSPKTLRILQKNEPIRPAALAQALQESPIKTLVKTQMSSLQYTELVLEVLAQDVLLEVKESSAAKMWTKFLDIYKVEKKLVSAEIEGSKVGSPEMVSCLECARAVQSALTALYSAEISAEVSKEELKFAETFMDFLEYYDRLLQCDVVSSCSEVLSGYSQCCRELVHYYQKKNLEVPFVLERLIVGMSLTYHYALALTCQD